MRVAVLAAILTFGLAGPAAACRCWVGNDETTDEERIAAAWEAVTRADIAVVGVIHASNRTLDREYTHRDAATIDVEKTLVGITLQRIDIPRGAGVGVYTGAISDNLLGTCEMTWREGQRGVWLLLMDANNQPVLASSCAHEHVRKWLPELGN